MIRNDESHYCTFHRERPFSDSKTQPAARRAPTTKASAPVQVTITCSVEQAQAIAQALDIYTRLGLGQLGIVAEMVRDGVIPQATAGNEPRRTATNEMCVQVESALSRAKTVLGYPKGGSNGIGHKHNAMPVSRTYQVLKNLRHALAWHQKPGGGVSPDFDDPNLLNYAGEAPPFVTVSGGGQ